MGYRTGLEIKKAILTQLKKGEQTISQLERSVNTSDRVIKRHIRELAYLNIITITRHNKAEHTNRPYTTVQLAK